MLGGCWLIDSLCLDLATKQRHQVPLCIFYNLCIAAYIFVVVCSHECMAINKKTRTRIDI